MLRAILYVFPSVRAKSELFIAADLFWKIQDIPVRVNVRA